MSRGSCTGSAGAHELGRRWPWLNCALAAVVQATSPWSRLDRDRTHRHAMKDLNRRLGTRQHQAFTAEGLKMQRRRETQLKDLLAQAGPGAPRPHDGVTATTHRPACSWVRGRAAPPPAAWRALRRATGGPGTG